MAIIDKPSDYFNTVLYTGNATGRTITGVGFQPDWVWGKVRSEAQDHVLVDSIRGATKQLYSSDSAAEQTEAQGLTGFDSDGFTLGTHAYFNGNSKTYVAWNWKAGTSFTNDQSATGIGTIDSTGSVSTDAGFSIVTFTNSGSGVDTIAHGLGVVPTVVIAKTRSHANGWFMYHKDIGNTKFLRLETTGAATANTMWNDTTPTSTVFSLNSGNIGTSRNIVAYSFVEKKGYSKFGSYIANANVDGAFVYTGFKPAFLLIKNTSQATDWIMYDNKRDGYEPQNKEFRANTSAAERNAEDNNVQFCANGFKTRNAGSKSNADSGDTLIYMSFAENPLVTSTGVPATAR